MLVVVLAVVAGQERCGVAGSGEAKVRQGFGGGSLQGAENLKRAVPQGTDGSDGLVSPVDTR